MRYESGVQGLHIVYTNQTITVNNRDVFNLNEITNIRHMSKSHAFKFDYRGGDVVLPYEPQEKDMVMNFFKYAIYLQRKEQKSDSAKHTSEAQAKSTPESPKAAVNTSVQAEPVSNPKPETNLAFTQSSNQMPNNETSMPGSEGANTRNNVDDAKSDGVAASKSKMKLCKTCGKEIAKKAKSCPYCGAKNKKPIYKRVWFIILCAILAIIIVGCVAGGSDDDSSSSTSNKKIEYTSYDISTMLDDLEDNAASAKDKYDGKYVKITGKLSTIDSDGSYISIEDPSDEWSLDDIMCYIESDEQLKQVKNYSTGDTITVKGKITEVGEVMGYSLDIDKIEK